MHIFYSFFKTRNAVQNPVGDQNPAFLSTKIVENTSFAVISEVIENTSLKMAGFLPTLASKLVIRNVFQPAVSKILSNCYSGHHTSIKMFTNFVFIWKLVSRLSKVQLK